MTKKYIDADALIAECEEEIVDYDFDLQRHFVVNAVPTEYIENFPAADVEEVKHGHWNFTSCVAMRCSECNEAIMFVMGVYDEARERRKQELQELYKYCPFCGAKMDGKENNNV